MRLFSLSTAEQGASMALFDGRSLVCEAYWSSPKTHSKRIMAMVEQMVVRQAGMEIGDIDGFIAAKGPGSFTGLRIGISVIKGLACALSKPCAGVSSLDGIAHRFSYADTPVCALMDAKRNEVYGAVYEFSRGRLVKKSREMVCPPEDAIAMAGKDAAFVGSGSQAYRELILNYAGQDAWISDPSGDFASAAALVRVALGIPDVFSTEAHGLVPVYLRKSDAEMNL